MLRHCMDARGVTEDMFTKDARRSTLDELADWNGKTFAMLVKGRLVVKLPRDRVEELLAAGAGDRFDPDHGRLMREWISLAEATDPTTCRTMLAEALTFVAAAVLSGGRG